MKPILPLLFILSLLAPAGRALAQFDGDGLKAVYYTNPDLTSAAVSVTDPQVSFRWNGCPPQPGMSASSFSVRWTGWLEAAYSEPYTIITV
ncbi:MAG TPA: PA14 domain-containing protein, partial [bacterium]|nr:PA14 domain-containing protein [bacterium]